jgi:DNA primase large subunit
MLQKEFEQRVKMNVSIDEFAHINEVYMNSDLEKDDFCKEWVKMNKTRVQRAKEAQKKEQERQNLRDALTKIMSDIQWLSYDQQLKIAVCYLSDREVRTIQKAGISLETPNGEVNRFKYGWEVARDIKHYLGI